MYLPDLPTPVYQNLLDELELEFTYTFGGCTVLRGLDGSYVSRLGLVVRDRINLIYSDTPVSLDQDSERMSRYTDRLREAAVDALDEEAVLVAVVKVYHAV